MTKIEQALKEIITKQNLELRQKIIRDMTEVWDKEEIEGTFQEFIIDKFVLFYIARVILN